MKKVIIIGGGFGGLTVASFLTKSGYSVKLFEKNSQIGGRVSTYNVDGFLFDKGPSWYLMPEIFERYFKKMNRNLSDYYQLERLNPNYRLFFEDGDIVDIPAEIEGIHNVFEKIEKGSAKKLDEYLKNAAYQYNLIDPILYKSYDSLKDLLDINLILKGLKLKIFNYMDDYVKKYFKNQKLRQIIEYTTVFLGSSPYNTPAFYSIMSHVDFNLGVYYPQGGFSKIADAYEKIAKEYGCEVQKENPVIKIIAKNGKVVAVETTNGSYECDILISNADAYYTEMKLLDKDYRSYDEIFWGKKIMGPSSFLLFLGIDGKISDLKHHNLYLAKDWKKHFDSIFKQKIMPENPSFYISVTSKTDKTTAPEGKENLFVLVPIASGIEDNEKIRKIFFDLIVEKISKLTNFDLKKKIIFKRTYSINDFISDYNSHLGTALGLSHANFQTAFFRLPFKSKKLKNLYYVGHYTHPGIGLPMVTIAGEIVSRLVADVYK